MKSKAIKELKAMGKRRINGKKVELYSFYQLVGFLKMIESGQEVK